MISRSNLDEGGTTPDMTTIRMGRKFLKGNTSIDMLLISHSNFDEGGTTTGRLLLVEFVVAFVESP